MSILTNYYYILTIIHIRIIHTCIKKPAREKEREKEREKKREKFIRDADYNC